jgi:uncharacterized protein YjiS (DUF1127 family)
MESAMRPNDEIDISSIDWRRLTPAEQARLRARIIERAQAARIEAWCDALIGALSLGRRIGAALLAAWRDAANWLERKRAIRQLHALDDRALRDIGLDRSEIDAAVEGRNPASPTTAEVVAARDPKTPLCQNPAAVAPTIAPPTTARAA